MSCTDVTTPRGGPVSPAIASAGTAPAAVLQGKPFHPHPDEVEFREIADSIDSFGGYWLDARTGTLKVFVTDSRDVNRAEAMVAARTIPQRNIAKLHGLRGDVAVSVVTYRFRDLSDWRDSISFKLLGLKAGVLWVDLDESANRVAVGIVADRSESVRAELEAKLVQYGIPRAAVTIEATSGYAPNQDGTTLSDVSRPVLPGTLIYTTAPAGCTMGPIVKVDGTMYLTTNAHCSLPASVTGLGMQQPSGYAVGTEYWDREPYLITWGGQYIFDSRWSDAALYSIDGGISVGYGEIARTTGDRSIIIDPGSPFFQMTGQEQGGMANGWFVYKVGAVTGWTYGYVTKSCFDAVQAVTNRNFHCNFEADYFNQPGDSGSPVFAPYNGGFIVVGINWGHDLANGRGVFSGLRGIEMDLLGSFDTGRFFAY